MLVLSSAIVLADVADGLSLDHPVIGSHNVVTAANIVADTSEANYPASNLANPATYLEWHAADDSEQEIVVTTNYVDEIDYVGVARHNWGTGAIPVSILDASDNVLVEEVILPDDSPALFRFTAQSEATVKIHLGEGSVVPRAAVVYVGKLLVIERKIYVGHTPLPHGRKTSYVNGMSETGNLIGRIQLGEFRESTVPLSLITPEWLRETMVPFLKVGSNDPFFFGWRPQTYPREIGFCWLMEEPEPVPTGPSNLVAFDMKLRGVA